MYYLQQEEGSRAGRAQGQQGSEGRRGTLEGRALGKQGSWEGRALWRAGHLEGRALGKEVGKGGESFWKGESFLEGKSSVGEKADLSRNKYSRWHGEDVGGELRSSFWSCDQYGQVISFKAWKGLRTVPGTRKGGGWLVAMQLVQYKTDAGRVGRQASTSSRQQAFDWSV